MEPAYGDFVHKISGLRPNRPEPFAVTGPIL
jgi:hypothetical protein